MAWTVNDKEGDNTKSRNETRQTINKQLQEVPSYFSCDNIEDSNDAITTNGNDAIPKRKKSALFSEKLSLILACVALGSDGYLTNIIGAVERCLSTIYGPNLPNRDDLFTRVSNAMLIGDIVGQIGFGVLIDRLGRRFGIIACTICLCLGVVMCTVANGSTPTGLIWMLIISRGLTGVGVGGEYPCSSVTAGEAAEESGRSRGFWLIVSGCFVIDFGFLIATIVPVILLLIFGTNGLEAVWRTCFGLGIILPLCILYFRIRLIKKSSRMHQTEALTKRVPYLLIFRKYWRRLLITGGIWFLYNFIIYPFGIFSDTILSLAVPDNSLLQTLKWNIVLNLFYPAGAFVGALVIDRWGRKNVITLGFLIQAIIGIVLGVAAPTIIQKASLFAVFVILYGFFLFFGEFGPGDCTILIAAEMFPTAIRGTMYGLSAALGKTGAAIGTQIFKPVLQAFIKVTNGDVTKAQGYVFILGSCVGLVGAIVCYFFVPEMPESSQELDQEFRKILSENGYDLQFLGLEDKQGRQQHE